jgi:hypothetical protein
MVTDLHLRGCRIACTNTSCSPLLSESNRHQLRQLADNAWRHMAIEHLVQPSWPRCVRGCQAFGKLADLLPAWTEGLFCPALSDALDNAQRPSHHYDSQAFPPGRKLDPIGRPPKPQLQPAHATGPDKRVSSTHRTIWLRGMHLRFTLFISPARGHCAPISWPPRYPPSIWYPTAERDS